MLRDEVEEDVDPFGRREIRVVLLVSTLGVSDAREHLGNAFHLQRIAQSQGRAHGRFGRFKWSPLEVGKPRIPATIPGNSPE